MDSWRDAVLQDFTPQVAHLTLVADPDGLLLEAGVLRAIEQRGFELIAFEDPVAFRFAYESRYRTPWDRGESTDLVVVLQAAATNLMSLPFDLLQAGRSLSFSLGDIFRNLSYPVVASLDPSSLDALFDAQQRHAPSPLGDNATKDFILRHVFGVAPEMVKEASDLLRLLLRRHHQGLRIPSVLDERLIELLRQDETFGSWPLESILPDRSAFFAFLQERWPVFLDRVPAGKGRVREPTGEYGLEFAGPQYLPFDHDDVRVLMDNLFLEGMLEPVEHDRGAEVAGSWARVGVRIEPQADLRDKWGGLLDALNGAVPSQDAPHEEWQLFAPKWAQLIMLRHAFQGLVPEEGAAAFEELEARADQSFAAWLSERYGTLHNQPAVPPVMVHHLPRALARHLDRNPGSKAALLVMDGLSLDQWLVVRDVLKVQRPGLRFGEGSVFAWIPTLTMVSRQASFAGRPPLYFPASIHTTEKEPKLWQRFWEDEGLPPACVKYAKGIRDEPDLRRVDDLLSHPQVQVVGLVVDVVDRIMHGMELGTAGMHNQVRQWAEQGVLAGLIDLLHEKGFTVFLTADHGNVEATGCGRPAEGVIADLRSMRARIFPDEVLRASVHERFPESTAWPALGLPPDYLPLLAPGRQAFVKEGERLVTHGGISLEEVIVPFVQIGLE